MESDYSSEDYARLSELASQEFSVSYPQVKTLDARLKDLITHKLEDSISRKRVGKKTNAKARGQDIRHTADLVEGSVFAKVSG